MTHATETPEIVWLVQGAITDQEVADMWSAQLWDPEFRLLDHPTNPSSSSDFPTKFDAMEYAKAQGLAVVDLT
jgi:hypothetical protein